MKILTLDGLIEIFEKLCCELHGDLVVAKQFVKIMYPDATENKWEYFLCLRSVVKSDGSLPDIKKTHLRHQSQHRIRKQQRKTRLAEARQEN